MRGLAIILGALALGACAAPGGFIAPEDEAQSAYGPFLAARYAGASRDVDASARLYAEAMAFEPGSDFLTSRAFLSALMAGDFARADATAAAAAGTGDVSRLAQVYLAAASLAGARVTYPEIAPSDPFGDMIADMLNDWRAASKGRRQALAATDRPESSAFSVTGHMLPHRALLLETAGAYDRAESAYRAADASLDLDDFTTVLLGEFLERRGRRQEAVALYDRRLARTPGREDAEIVAARARAASGGRAPRLPDADEAAARALFPPAAILAAQAPADYSALYLRLVQRLDSRFDRNTLTLAAMLDGLDLLEAAADTFRVVQHGPFAAEAAVNAAWIDFRAGRTEIAVDRARDLAETTRREESRLLLADLLRATDRCEEAVALYDRVRAERAGSGLPADWRHAYFAGLCVQTGRGWAEAEPYLVAALEAAPDEPRVLNHLGYQWIVGGERVEEGFALVARAAELAPDNGSILDSLGWGHFKQGRAEEAVRWLERAIALSPSNPTINWHLGDAYARVGRDLEARFQWRRARELDPDPEELTLIERRLTLGLDAGPEDLP